jgi:tRNA (guanine37-N1)-methyltransferase
MEICFITIFPGMMKGPLESGILGIGASKGAAVYSVIDLRDFAVDKHGSIDDYPYGGGPGMVMMASPVVEAVESVIEPGEAGKVPVILMSPAGRRFDQSVARELAGHDKLVFICGRYKGIDARIEELTVTDILSIGDYIVSGGELPALVVADAVVRHLPGVMGDERSRDTDSFSEERAFMLDAAYYTRPPEYRGLKVPETLQSGDHARIERWREESALERTKRLRPDLLGGGDGDSSGHS